MNQVEDTIRMPVEDDHRLTRIETKLDRLAEAMSALVRVEERVSTIFTRLASLDNRINGHSTRIEGLEQTNLKRAPLLSFLERAFWIIATALVAYAFTRLRDTGKI